MTDEQLFADVPHPAESAAEPPPSDDVEPDVPRTKGPSPFVHGLNADQLDAVVHDDGPLLVVAGAGSGKTRVLTHRIAHLIHEGVHPSKILAITFTNKAASEMRERVHELVGPVVKTMWVSTFHSACVRILRANGEAIGYPRQFSIYDSADSNRLVSYVIRDLGLDSKRFTPRGVQGIISLKKNELVTPEEMSDQAENIFDRKHAEVYAEYQARLLKAGAMDFDDLLINVVKLFREHGNILEHYRERFSHILVDEYQDTNQAQNEIVLMLAGGHRGVTVVGDSDQGVYGWRGADLRNILDFEEAFPDVTTVVLDQNYRSTQTILDAANAVIDNNTERKPKALWTDLGSGDTITRYHAEDEGDEATFIASTARQAHESEGADWRDMAVLYRTNAQSRVLEEAFMRVGVPYKVVGGTRFYDRREVKDAMAYLRTVVNPNDEVSLKRILNTPKRGIGDASVDKLDAFSRAEAVPFVEALRRCEEAGVSGKALRGISQFVELLDGLNATAADPSYGPGDVLQLALDGSGYLAELDAEDTVEAHTRIENLGELVGSAREFTVIDEFMEQVALVADTDQLDDDNHVVLMTLHSAKGLEYPTVFLAGVEEGVFPHVPRADRAGTDGGGTAARVRRHHPSHAAPLHVPRMEPATVRFDPVQPAVPILRRDPCRTDRVEGQRVRALLVRAPELSRGARLRVPLRPAGVSARTLRRRDRWHRHQRRHQEGAGAAQGPGRRRRDARRSEGHRAGQQSGTRAPCRGPGRASGVRRGNHHRRRWRR